MARLWMDDAETAPLPPWTNPAYLSAVDEIYHDRWAAEKLLRIRWLERSIRHFWPQGHPTRIIHVAGTNGKGSTCRLLEAGLSLAGPAGAMTNPHLFDYAERCSVGGVALSHDQVARLWTKVLRPHSLDRAEEGLERALSFAEAGLLMALLAFDEASACWGVVETGVGGRYAPSMALDPACCVLTNVGRDHPQTLGHQLWQRALEKAGIAREGLPLFTAATGQALDMVRRVADHVGAPLTVVDEDAVRLVREEAADWEGEDPQRGGRPGHAWCNLALALAVIRHLEPGLETARLLPRLLQVSALPGRFWQPKPHVVADVAHNADKVAALAGHLKLRFPGRSLVLVVGISRDRPLAETLAPLVPSARLVILSSASYAGRNPFALEEECHSAFPDLPTEVVEDPARAVERAELVRAPEELVVVTGSAYTLDQAFNPDPLMKRMNAEYGRRGGNH